MLNINLFYTRIILVYLAFYMVNMNLNVFVDETKSGYCIDIAEETDAEESEKTKELSEENEYKISRVINYSHITLSRIYRNDILRCDTRLFPPPYLLAFSPPPES
ncbi:MAG: hypothetical protein JNL75_09035 [Chitinophagales bacterium]|nr:hypothetical protein [Chitinophagales bacterium]